MVVNACIWLSADSDCGRGARQCSESPFSLLLKSQQNIPLGPRGSLQIPVTFAPHEMKSYQQRCTVSMRREDGLAWDAAQSCESHHSMNQNGSALLLVSPGGTRWYLPDISFTLTNRIIYLGDVSSQNHKRTAAREYITNSWRYGASLISHHWILCRTPLFWGKRENATKNVRVPLFGKSSWLNSST